MCVSMVCRISGTMPRTVDSISTTIPDCGGTGTVHVFPGVYDASVTDAAFAGLLAPGGFEFSAKRVANATEFVAITNVYGVAVTVSHPDPISHRGLPAMPACVCSLSALEAAVACG